MAEAMTEEQVQAELGSIAKNALASTSGAGAAEAAEAEKAAADKAAAEAATAEKARAEADAAAAGSGDDDAGDDDGGGDTPYKNSSDAKNFRALRKVTETLAEQLKQANERASRLEAEAAKRDAAPVKDPLEEVLEKMDPAERERLRASGVLPLLEKTVEEVKALRPVKRTVEEIQKEREQAARAERAEKNYYAALGKYGKENALDKSFTDEMDALIDAGKVGGDTARELFDNAREYVDLKRGSSGKKGDDADRAAAAARKAAASGADASAGSAAGTPVPSRKALTEKYEDLRKTDPAEADRVLIASLTNPGDLPRLKAGLQPK